VKLPNLNFEVKTPSRVKATDISLLWLVPADHDAAYIYSS